MYHDHAFKSPITRRDHAQNCLESALVAARPQKTSPKGNDRMRRYSAVIAVTCTANTTVSRDTVMRFDHLTLGGIYPATAWRHLSGDKGLIIRTDDGNHSWFPIRMFRPVNRRHLVLWGD